MMDHAERIRDQFTRQAIPYSRSPAMSNEEALQMLVAFSSVGAADTVLDVCCGPGLVAAAFARNAKHVTGIDFTPAMITQAEAHCAERGLKNVAFHTGDGEHLPFADGAYSLVLSRFAFHHLERPSRVLAEMARVCAKDGRILLVDAVCADDPAKAAAFNASECIRDPSHVAYRPEAELADWFKDAGLPIQAMHHFGVPLNLEAMLARSFPDPGGADRVRAAYAEALPRDGFGIPMRSTDKGIHVEFPAIAILAKNR